MGEDIKERIRVYTKGEIKDIVSDGDYHVDDLTYLCALSSHAEVLGNPFNGSPALMGLRSISIPVITTDKYVSGYYVEAGQQPMIVINVDASVIDYDFISDIHPMQNMDVYLWTDMPYTEDSDYLGLSGEWYRRDVYPDKFKPFNGDLRSWEDLPPESYNEEDDE